MSLRGKSSPKVVPAVGLDERETHVCYSVGDVRHGGDALVETFDPKLKARVLKAGGKLVRTYQTNPVGWALTVPASLVRISMSVSRKRDLSPETRARLAENMAKARLAKQVQS